MLVMCYSLTDVVVGNHKNCLYYKNIKKTLRLSQKQIGDKDEENRRTMRKKERDQAT